jgi:TRAP transporter TAXI family solute receptor
LRSLENPSGLHYHVFYQGETMKKLPILLLAAAVVVPALAGCSKKADAAPAAASQPAAETVKQIRLATGGSTGTYYAFGSAVAQIMTEKTGVPITIQSTGASKANIQLIESGDVEMAIVQNDVMDYAYKGTDLFNGEQIQDFTAMAALYAEVCQVVANPGAGIKTIADLKGKNVSVGDAGSGTEFNARQILEAYNITFNDIKKQNLSFGASADALRDNKIDAFFCVAGAPTTAIVDLAIGKEIAVLEVDDSPAAALMAKYPFYTQYPIPGGSYRGVSGDVKTVAVKATFIVSNKLPAEAVYNLTRTLFENKSAIEAAHAKGKEISASYAVEGISVPFHPGAEKYFKETGALK